MILFFVSKVDVVGVQPIAAFCSSDEDDEDQNVLLFLPTAPEVRTAKSHFIEGTVSSLVHLFESMHFMD